MSIAPFMRAARLASLIAPAALAAVVLEARTGAAFPAAVAERAEFVMGTVARVAVPYEAATESRPERALAEALAKIRQVDRAMSLYRSDSELVRLNAHAAHHAERVSEDLFWLLVRAQELSAVTDGAFDVTVLPLLRAWGGYRTLDHLGHSRPGAVGFAALRLDPAARSVRFELPGMAIDLGGVAKGFALDRARAHLRRVGVARARLDLGGTLAFAGAGPGGCWQVAVRDPARPDGPLGMLALPADYAVATSANYARDFAAEGWRAPSHVYDPRTRRPVLTRGAVTVWAPDATTADALATAFLVSGASEARSVVHRMADVGALFAQGDGTRRVELMGAAPCGWRARVDERREHAQRAERLARWSAGE